MSETPHCPNCGRSDTVDPRKGSTTYEWVCTNISCSLRLITQDDVRDVPFMDMCRTWGEDDTDTVDEQEYSDECGCDWCLRGRPRP